MVNESAMTAIRMLSITMVMRAEKATYTMMAAGWNLRVMGGGGRV